MPQPRAEWKTERTAKYPLQPAPAYFTSLTLENIRCFGPEQTLDLSDGRGHPARWTILLGDNGLGKTTLLQCLAMLQPVREEAFNGKQTSVQYVPRILVSFDSHRNFKTNAPREYPWTFGVTFAVGHALENTDEKLLVEDFTVRQWALDSGTVSVTKRDISGLIYCGYGATRRMGGGALSSLQESDSTRSLFVEGTSLVNAEEWFLQADYTSRRSPNSSSARVLFQTKYALVRLLPDVQDLRISDAGNDSLAAQVELLTPFGWVHIQNLSLGYRTLIAWVVDFAYRMFERYPNSENPLAEPAVVLVDEIDLHLHPKFQRILMDYLTDLFPNTQFIATAHSPLVVQAAKDANIVLLRREGDHVIIDNDVERIKNWRIDQVLTSDLFGLESARPPQLDKAMKERERILTKARLTKADKVRLSELEAEIGDLPTGETPADIQAMDIIRRAAEHLKHTNGTK